MLINIETWYSLLHEVNPFSIIIRIGMALLMGGILGAERGLRNRPAGFMTYVLVCMGATMIMLTNQYISVFYPKTDPTRLAAQVVSGIGFLGAGTIIVTRNDEVRGLTTAAGLWLAAGLGLAAGSGFYSGAIIGFLFSIFALINLKKVDIYIKQHAKSMEVYLEYNPAFSLRKLSEYAQEHHFELFEMQRGKIKTLNGEMGTLVFSIDLTQKLNHSEVLDSLYSLEGVEYLREIS
jgi:putative Mg2+ transporter-C (MgtC) family protein